MPESAHLPWSVQIAFALLGALTLGFLVFFIAPAARVANGLRSVSRALSRSNAAPNADLSPVFEGVPGLEHPWREFYETLHEERVLNLSTGVVQIAALRATVPAETFFTESYIVDGPLATEFFKHLPGIFTGIGIIGTFLGLLRGLRAFQITDDPTAVHASLEQLMHGVSDAFMVSFAAIALAMLITFVEKLVLVRLYARVRRLTQAIDERFKAGVGEEYLSRLVGAAEDSAGQARILKNALVGDLKLVLKEVSQYQIKAFRAAQQALGQYIGDTIALQLRGPMLRLADATEKVRGDQNAAVQQLVDDVLTRFSKQLQQLVGSHGSGLDNTQQQQMIDALRDVVTQLQQNVRSMEAVGQRAPDMRTEELTGALHKLDQRQLVLNEEVRTLVAEVRSLISDSQVVAIPAGNAGNAESSRAADTSRLDTVVARLDTVSTEPHTRESPQSSSAHPKAGSGRRVF